MKSYSELYVEDAQACLGEMLDYAVTCLGMQADAFFQAFAVSEIARSFERGNPKYVAGMTGVDLAHRVLGGAPQADAFAGLRDSANSWYWTGWALAYYQWHSCLSFVQLLDFGISPSRVESGYVLHEADTSVFVQRMDAVVEQARQGRPSRLRSIRKARKMTQGQLAEASGTSLRMIQLYEQGQSNIDSAAASTLARISRVLGCNIEDLLEQPYSSEYEYQFVEL